MDIKTIAIRWQVLHGVGLKQRTRDSYKDTINNHIIPVLGDYEIDDTDLPLAIAGLLRDKIDAGMARTSQLIYITLRQITRGYQPDCMAGISKPRYTAGVVQPWTDDQMRTYMRGIQESRQYIPLLLAITCGLRRGELCGLQWTDIYDGIIHIQRQRIRCSMGLIVTTPKTAAGVRDIPMPEGLADILDRYRADGWICTCTPERLYRVHVGICKRCGLPVIGLHGLRHSFASAIVRHGGQVSGLQMVLGHQHYATTADVYAPPDADCARGAVAAFVGVGVT